MSDLKSKEEILKMYESFHCTDHGLDETHYYEYNVLLAMEDYANQFKQANGDNKEQGKALRLTGVVPSTFTEWTKCPECGCLEFTNENELGKGFRMCKKEDCRQEWWTDIDYTDIDYTDM